MATHSVLSRASTWLLVRNTRSVISRNSASPIPSAKPPTVAIAKMRNDLGELLVDGGKARVTWRFAYRKGLLLSIIRVTLLEVVIERTIGLRRASQVGAIPPGHYLLFAIR